MKGKLFRKVVNIADRVNVWFLENLSIDPKRVAMEQAQDLVPLKRLDKTIGKSLGVTK